MENSVTSGHCNYCDAAYVIPAKGIKEAVAAVKAAGWLTVSKGGEIKTACPNDKCQNKITIWFEEGIEQSRLDFDGDEDEDGDIDG